jgi:hypothetical protein
MATSSSAPGRRTERAETNRERERERERERDPQGMGAGKTQTAKVPSTKQKLRGLCRILTDAEMSKKETPALFLEERLYDRQGSAPPPINSLALERIPILPKTVAGHSTFLLPPCPQVEVPRHPSPSDPR